MHDDAVHDAGGGDDRVAIDLDDLVAGQGGLPRREGVGAVARRDVVVLRQQHDVVAHDDVCEGVVRLKRVADVVHAGDGVAVGRHGDGLGVGDLVVGRARGERIVGDDDLVVTDDLHPHVDVLGRVHARWERVGDLGHQALVAAPEIDDVGLGEPEVLVGDQACGVRVAQPREVVVAPAVDKRDLVLRLAAESGPVIGHQVVVGARAVVGVIHDGAHAAGRAVALEDVARAVVAHPDRIGGAHIGENASGIGPGERHGAGDAARLACRVAHDVDIGVARGGDVDGHLLEDATPPGRALVGHEDALGRLVLGGAADLALGPAATQALGDDRPLGDQAGLGGRERTGQRVGFRIGRPG